MPPRRVQAALALIERRDRYLICQRRPKDFLGGYWEFPGGKREPGESWQACLHRELREELGVAIRVAQPYLTLRHRYRSRSIVFKVFHCAIIRGRPRPLAAQTLRWVSVQHLRRYRFPPANRPLLVRLIGR